MSRFCKIHLRWSCPLCSPTATSTSGSPSTNGGNQTSPQQLQTTNTKGIMPSAVSTSPTTAAASTTATASSTGTPIAASNPAGASFGTMLAPFPPSSTPNGTTLKRQATSADGPKKRRKRIKKTVIDDEVACKIFRLLRLTNSFLSSGKVLAWALQPDDPVFANIYNYVAASQEHGFGVKVVSILRVIVKTDEDPIAFSEDPNMVGKNRMMLWHGTKTHALPSILQNGLRLPTMYGQMFGAGVYFADRVSKSCQYCDHGLNHYAGSMAYLFLCDVFLGKVYNAYRALPDTRSPPWGFDSIRGCGASVPAPEWNQTIDGCVWPIGPTVDNKVEPSNRLALNYNEYIVYKSEQVQPKYLVKVQFTAKPVAEMIF